VTDALIIETAELRKNFGLVEAVRGLDLQVPRGSIYGFLGRNGSGKTTTIKILLGMASATAGRATVFGLHGQNVEIRRRTAFVSEEKDLYDYMTAGELIRFTAAFYSRWNAGLERRYMQLFELPAGVKVKAFSRGMRTKLALLLALCRGAELLILDEPTSGLDPAATEQVLQALVSHVAREEITVFFSSHQLAEVEQIADRVTIVDRGRAVVTGALEDLRENYRRVQLVFAGDAPDVKFRTPGIVGARRDGRTLTVLTSSGAEQLVEEARTLNPVSVDVLPVALKEIFLETIHVDSLQEN
jgi:ABC-2 type transport system ATP-binding protein